MDYSGGSGQTVQRGPKNDYSNKMLTLGRNRWRLIVSLCVEIIMGKKGKDGKCDKVLAVGGGGA